MFPFASREVSAGTAPDSQGIVNSKSQIPNSKQIPITEKAMTETSLFGIWVLEFIWSRASRDWCLGFGA
jgi:hypothetical protein